MYKTISIVVLVIISVVSMAMCSNRPSEEEQHMTSMIQNVEYCEATLDTLANIISFDDTVAEGDAYQDLLDAKHRFDEADTEEVMEECYYQYKKAFNKVYWQAIYQVKIQEERDSL